MQQQLVVSNLGGGQLNFTLAATGGSWLTASTAAGQAAPGAPALVGLTLNPQGLNPGTYRGQIVIRTTDASQSSTVAITLTVNALSQSIVLTQTGFQFTAVSGGTPPPAQTFVILNGGLGTMNWTAVPQTISGANWLRSTPGSGSATAGVSTATPVSVSVDPKNLTPGVYYGLVRVAALGAANSSQLVSVTVNVLAPGDLPAPAISSVGLLPVGLVAGPNATDSTTLYNLTTQAQPFTSTVSTQDGSGWLSVSPASGTVPAAGNAVLAVQANPNGLTSGVRYGLVRLAFPDGTVRTLSVVSVLGPAAGSAAQVQARAVGPAAGCVPTSLALTVSSLEAGFSVTAAQAVPMQAKIVDNCGIAVTRDAMVAITFSSKDPTLSMVPGAGVWNSTWTPRNPGSNIDVFVTAFLVQGQYVIGGQSKLTGSVKTASSSSAALPNLLANSASYQAPGLDLAGKLGFDLWPTDGGRDWHSKRAPFPERVERNASIAGRHRIASAVCEHRAGERADSVQSLREHEPSAAGAAQRYVVSAVGCDGSGCAAGDLYDQSKRERARGNPDREHRTAGGAGRSISWLAARAARREPVNLRKRTRAGAEYAVRRCRRARYTAAGDDCADPDGDDWRRSGDNDTVLGTRARLVGLYQLNVQVPAGVEPGDAVEVVITVNGNVSNTVTIAVGQ